MLRARISSKYKDDDFVELNNLLYYVPWSLAIDDGDLKYSMVRWIDLFLADVDDVVPKVQIKSANRTPWIDAEVLKAVRKKERLRKKKS